MTREELCCPPRCVKCKLRPVSVVVEELEFCYDCAEEYARHPTELIFLGDLKACPWCGTPALVTFDDRCGTASPEPDMLMCSNRDCALRPMLWFADFEDEGAAVQAWNKRIDVESEAVALLERYRKETPLGHQPHMIAHEADRVIAKARGAAA